MDATSDSGQERTPASRPDGNKAAPTTMIAPSNSQHCRSQELDSSFTREDTTTTGGEQDRSSSERKPIFAPRERPPSRIALPDELWLAILECPCTFPADIFRSVMLNLVKNPNVTSSHLFRADIFYDSDAAAAAVKQTDGPLLQHLKAEYRPRPPEGQWRGFELERTLVRQLIPRNPQLDRPLLQTCHFFRGHRADTEDDSKQGEADEEEEQTLVLYIPHVQSAAEIPFYHPAVSQLAFLHTSPGAGDQGSVTILYRCFVEEEEESNPDRSSSSPHENKLQRTARKLLETIHKHGQGQLRGYRKRVRLDAVIPQKRYQDTYTRLKAAYAKRLSDAWVEVTDPGKHVFEDLGIAAYLIELWRGMYRGGGGRGGDDDDDESKPAFPGFVDIGCGNGVLVHVLVSEGYEGWGFDARRRKTWDIFPAAVRERLQQRVLVPRLLGAEQRRRQEDGWWWWWHDGVFAPGTFIVSNHADELTPWTPLLACLNGSSFLAIPCCSHDLAGARFRAPATTRNANVRHANRLPQQDGCGDQSGLLQAKQAAETGSLKRTEAQKKMPSAYSTLCSYVASLAAELGFAPETDVLRIPSTRNACIIGRGRVGKEGEHGEGVERTVEQLIERELKRDLSSVAVEWVERAEKLTQKPSSGH